MLTDQQKKASQAIVNIFETSKPQGDYGKVTLLRGDSGHLTYGRSQTTLSSGNLYLLIKDYCDTPDAEFATKLKDYLEKLSNRDTSLDRDATLRNYLREAGDDPVMQDVQDRFFDRIYWSPSVNRATSIGINTALGVSVVYDSTIHGSWASMRDRTISKHGTVSKIEENKWIDHYVNVRRNWLANHWRRILRKTVYRMDAFRKLIDQATWDLSLPFYVRGIRIDEDALEPNLPRVCAQDVEERLLLLRSPYMQGNDVGAIQKSLVSDGFSISVDGIFGPETEEAIKQLQNKHGLKPDGIVGLSTRSVLEL